MEKFQGLISVLSKPKISTKEVVYYLESINVSNDQIMKVLQKKPSLPDYENLPWVIESKIDKHITKKLKGNKDLSLTETLRLKEILSTALSILKKGHRTSTASPKMTGLKNYIKRLH